jgi:hypothetical protein
MNNYSEEQIKKALHQFIDDPETAKRFAAAMREGLEIAEMESESHPFEDEDESALKELNAELQELMELQGFTLWQTGGGCTAWGKYLLGGNDDKSPYMMIALDDCSEFTTLAEAHRKDALMVCCYTPEGEELIGHKPICYSWDEFKNNFKGGF